VFYWPYGKLCRLRDVIASVYKYTIMCVVRFSTQSYNDYEGNNMKLNTIKMLSALFLSAFILSGCESMSTTEEDTFTNPEMGSAANDDASTSAAPDEAEIAARELAAQELAAQQAQQSAMKEQAALREIRTFYFDFDQATIKTDSRAALAAHAAFLSSNPSVKILLEGHTDERGTKGYNMALGERRGNAVQQFLVVNGVSKAQIEVLSYGEERPSNSAHNESAWAQNRRAYIEYK
jgi:peptidoglycan-associated lipoprotein